MDLTRQRGAQRSVGRGGTVLASRICQISVDIEATSLGLKSNVTSDLTSDIGNSGPATDDITIVEPPAFSKFFPSGFIPLGVSVALNFTIDNSANVFDATDLDFTDTLPSGMIVGTGTPVHHLYGWNHHGCAGFRCHFVYGRYGACKQHLPGLSFRHVQTRLRSIQMSVVI